MGLAFRVEPGTDILHVAATAAATIAGLNPHAVAATKRVTTVGRVEAARKAMTGEVARRRHPHAQTPVQVAEAQCTPTKTAPGEISGGRST